MKRGEKLLRRALALLAAVGAAVLIAYHGGAAAYLLLWACLLPPVYALIWRLTAGRRFRVVLRPEKETATHGERLNCSLLLINDSPLPIPEVTVRLEGGKLRFDETGELRFSLAPNEVRTLELSPRCAHCGKAEFSAAAAVRDPFRLTEKRAVSVESLRVLPRLARLNKLLIAPTEERERRTGPRSYLGDRVPSGELQPYQPGDDVRRVNWKVSALQGRPVIRSLEPVRRDELALLPDSRAALPAGEEGWLAEDSVTEGALALADYYLRQRIPLRIVTDGGVRRIDAPEDLRRLNALVGGDFFRGVARPDELMERDLASGQAARRYILLTWARDEALLRRCARCIELGAEVSLIYIGEDGSFREQAEAVRRLDYHWVGPRRSIHRVLGGEAEGTP